MPKLTDLFYKDLLYCAFKQKSHPFLVLQYPLLPSDGFFQFLLSSNKGANNLNATNAFLHVRQVIQAIIDLAHTEQSK